jgi:hypothetical protein
MSINADINAYSELKISYFSAIAKPKLEEDFYIKP